MLSVFSRAMCFFLPAQRFVIFYFLIIVQVLCFISSTPTNCLQQKASRMLSMFCNLHKFVSPRNLTQSQKIATNENLARNEFKLECVISDTMVCTGCCTTLDHIVSFLFKQLTQKGEFQVCRSFSSFLDLHLFSGKKSRRGSINSREGEVFLQVLEQHPEILQQILSTVLNIIMFEDCRNQWSMSRPLLGLILLNEDVNNSILDFGIDFKTNSFLCSISTN